MAVTTRTLEIPEGIDPVQVLGPEDAVIDRIERAFPAVSILVRGNRIMLRARDRQGDIQAAQIRDLLTELMQTADQVPLDDDQVGRILDHRRLGTADAVAATADYSRPAEQKTTGSNTADRTSVNRKSQDRNTTDHTSVDRNYQETAIAEPERFKAIEDINQSSQAAPAAVRRRPLTQASKGPIRPKTAGQSAYVAAIETHTITFGIGPAGTGKTYLAVAKAVQEFRAGRIGRIILTRPAVEAGESLGFLPGTLNEKVDPYLRPLYDALADMLGTSRLHRLLADETIEVAPLAYMRGRTLNDAFVILDEAQNTTGRQMKMFLTRLGFNTKMVITGDVTQVDLGGPASGLDTIEQVLHGIDDIAFVHLQAADVVRNRLVGQIVRAYDRADQARSRRREQA
ncbi:PhoH family protein [Bifidobacterium asteroides]|uniref:PhoH-like protein n=1 Tax=Bifidobacterium asteroides TaxID=1684 RepID=A0A2N3R9Y0_9BIFI|nr:PhoH family protein [Bifidobacterium asteroides]PKV09293.1 phosphate starvation protein PhoH [Bifidobacterium asteroides]